MNFVLLFVRKCEKECCGSSSPLWRRALQVKTENIEAIEVGYGGKIVHLPSKFYSNKKAENNVG